MVQDLRFSIRGRIYSPIPHNTVLYAFEYVDRP